jgi:hypothetical protein
MSLGVTGVARQFDVDAFTPPPTQRSNKVVGWGFAVDGLLPVIPAEDEFDRGNKLTLTGLFVTGTGIADLVGSNGGAKFTPLPNPARANPPSVAERDRLSLPPDVRDYEPPEALYGGPDGLDVIRPLAPAALAALRPGGGFVMEIGAGQWAAVRHIVEQAGFEGIRVHDDLAGIPRVVVAGRP